MSYDWIIRESGKTKINIKNYLYFICTFWYSKNLFFFTIYYAVRICRRSQIKLKVNNIKLKKVDNLFKLYVVVFTFHEYQIWLSDTLKYWYLHLPGREVFEKSCFNVIYLPYLLVFVHIYRKWYSKFGNWYFISYTASGKFKLNISDFNFGVCIYEHQIW